MDIVLRSPAPTHLNCSLTPLFPAPSFLAPSQPLRSALEQMLRIQGLLSLPGPVATPSLSHEGHSVIPGPDGRREESRVSYLSGRRMPMQGSPHTGHDWTLGCA